jgi:hypothetical protein
MTFYLQLGPDALTELGFDQLQYLYDDNGAVLVLVDPTDLFQSGCVTGRPLSTVVTEHPVNSYDIVYPYCRTALTFRMDDPAVNPQLGQLIAMAPIISVRIALVGCDLTQPLSVTRSVLSPGPVDGCKASLFPGYVPTEFYLIVDTGALTLPARFNFTVTNGKVVREFWIGLRESRDSKPSGAINLRGTP